MNKIVTQSAIISVLGNQGLESLYLDLVLEDLVGSDHLQVVHNHRRVHALVEIPQIIIQKIQRGVKIYVSIELKLKVIWSNNIHLHRLFHAL